MIFKPFLTVIMRREEKLATLQSETELIQDELSNKRKHYDTTLNNARLNAATLFSSAKTDESKRCQETLSKAKNATEKKLDEAREEISGVVKAELAVADDVTESLTKEILSQMQT